MHRGGMEKGLGGPQPKNCLRRAGAAYKKLASDQIGGDRRYLTWPRLWAMVIVAAFLFSLASISPVAWAVANSFEATILSPRKLSSLSSTYPSDDKSESVQLHWERRTEQMFAFSSLKFKCRNCPRTLSRNLQPIDSASRSEISAEVVQQKIPTISSPTISHFIEDVVTLPEDLDLFILQQYPGEAFLAIHERISGCNYGGGLRSVPRMVDFLTDHRLAVACTRPAPLQAEKTLKVENVSLEFDGGLVQATGNLEPARWDKALVYAVQITEVDVIVYAKNIFDSSPRKKAAEYTELGNFRCRFGEVIETPVTAGALEVFRCEPPRVNHPAPFSTRLKVYLVYKGRIVPSIAYYEPLSSERRAARGAENLEVRRQEGESISEVVGAMNQPKKYKVCSCTMIWNAAKFLKEWVLYNSDLGVEKFFLYDNNSEDGIRRVVSSLSQFNINRRNWPWVKTQEAGFSHCALEAQRECSWILFTDVDEYLFPKRWLGLTEQQQPEARKNREKKKNPQVARELSDSPLGTLIEDTITEVTLLAPGNATDMAVPQEVGQISFLCRNFGPSGRSTSPSEGVTQGYTCRDMREQRHKSLVYFPALKSTLQNVIHHFYLAPNYKTVYLDVRRAVVNHYKFQAWTEFKTKFTKRASTVVSDWKDPKNLNSRDRPKGVGPEATKPIDWETSHCEVNDTALRDYARRRFGVLGSGDSVKMAWEL